MEISAIEACLPNHLSISSFFSLSSTDKIKVVELGLAFFDEGTNKMQYWENSQWEKKLKNSEKIYQGEKEELLKKNILLKDEFKNYCEASRIRQDSLVGEITEGTKQQFSLEITQLKEENREKINKINSLTANLHSLNDTIDNKYNARLNEMRAFYEEKLADLQLKNDLLHKEYQTKINSHITRTQNSTIKGQDGEEFIYLQLNLLFPSAEIEDTHKTPSRGDFILRDEDVIMMIENKNYSKNVQKSEVDKFYRDLDSPANSDIHCALFVSLQTGICCKTDFEFEVRNNKPILFLHKLQDNLYNLKLAFTFFKLILQQKELDLSNKELIGRFKNQATIFKRNFNKQKNILDRYHSNQINIISEQESQISGLYQLLSVKY